MENQLLRPPETAPAHVGLYPTTFLGVAANISSHLRLCVVMDSSLNPSLWPGVYDGIGLGLKSSAQSTWPEHRQELVTPQKYWTWLPEEGMLNGRQIQQIVRIE